MSWLLDSGNSILDAVSEVIAPTVKSSLEEFKRNWSVVKKFYLDKKCKCEKMSVKIKKKTEKPKTAD